MTWGGRQAELLVAQQAHILQTDEHKAMSPIALQALVTDLLKSTPYSADAVSVRNVSRARIFALNLDLCFVLCCRSIT